MDVWIFKENWKWQLCWNIERNDWRIRSSSIPPKPHLQKFAWIIIAIWAWFKYCNETLILLTIYPCIRIVIGWFDSRFWNYHAIAHFCGNISEGWLISSWISWSGLLYQVLTRSACRNNVTLDISFWKILKQWREIRERLSKNTFSSEAF